MAVSIVESVGRDGANKKPDIRKIQKLLNAIFPATPVEVNGECGPTTIRRIERFQRRFMRTPDGRVDPGGRTLRRLNAAAPGMQAEWGGDSSKWSLEKKLASLNDEMRTRTASILQALEDQSFKPKLVYAWRSVEVQRQLVEQGNSQVSFSFHNAQQPSGVPNAYAADIIDRRWAWSGEAKDNGFWDALGRAAKDEELFWGGNWRTFKDWAHVQLFPNRRLSEIKRESGLA